MKVPFTLRKNVAALCTPAEAAAYTAAIPAVQEQIIGVASLDAALALRASYIAIKTTTTLEKRWRVWLLDQLAERIREIKAGGAPVTPKASKAVTPVAVPTPAPATMPVEIAAASVKPSRKAKAKAKHEAAVDVVVAAAKVAVPAPAALAPSATAAQVAATHAAAPETPNLRKVPSKMTAAEIETAIAEAKKAMADLGTPQDKESRKRWMSWNAQLARLEKQQRKDQSKKEMILKDLAAQ